MITKSLGCHMSLTSEKKAMKISSRSHHNYLTQWNEDRKVHDSLNIQNFILNITKRITLKSYQMDVYLDVYVLL